MVCPKSIVPIKSQHRSAVSTIMQHAMRK